MTGLNLSWLIGLSFCSISGCIKRPRLRTYKKVMDASSLRLDRSELTSAEAGKGKKKKACDLLTRPVKAEGRMNATQLPRLTDVKKCSHCFSVCRFPSLFLSTAFGRERTAWRKLRRVIITCWKSQDFVISYQTHFTPHLMFPVYSFSPR